MATLTRRTHVARLTLEIDGTAYAVRPIVSEVPDVLKAFRLRRLDTGAVYDVARHTDHLSCGCGDFVYRRKDVDPKGCKHAKALVACGLLDPIP